ncbi:MAG: hypothetical protein R6X17_12365 [Candidatus Competibacteraceae bacterium]
MDGKRIVGYDNERGKGDHKHLGDREQPYRFVNPRQLLATRREGGPMTITELARRAQRDYKNVHGDVEKLIEWQIVVKDEHGQLIAPYSEIFVDVCLPQKQAA